MSKKKLSIRAGLAALAVMQMQSSVATESERAVCDEKELCGLCKTYVRALQTRTTVNDIVFPMIRLCGDLFVGGSTKILVQSMEYMGADLLCAISLDDNSAKELIRAEYMTSPGLRTLLKDVDEVACGNAKCVKKRGGEKILYQLNDRKIYIFPTEVLETKLDVRKPDNTSDLIHAILRTAIFPNRQDYAYSIMYRNIQYDLRHEMNVVNCTAKCWIRLTWDRTTVRGLIEMSERVNSPLTLRLPSPQTVRSIDKTTS